MTIYLHLSNLSDEQSELRLLSFLLFLGSCIDMSNSCGILASAKPGNCNTNPNVQWSCKKTCGLCGKLNEEKRIRLKLCMII